MEPYKIYCVTWNVNQSHPPSDLNLQSLLATTFDPPDIYAIGLQEVCMSPCSILKGENRLDYIWIINYLKGIHPYDSYQELVSIRLVGMMLTIIVKQSIVNSISKICKSSIGTGKLKLGNKGGVAVSFQLKNTLLCFVNSHFAAGKDNYGKRNSDFKEILEKVQFKDHFRTRSIIEHDQIYWLGDLNYRMTSPDDELIKRICNYQKLFYLDELFIQRKQLKRIFKDFHEGSINFPPTYKYNPLTDDWDTSSTKRCPAWCDRILWRGSKIEQISYQSVMDLRISDHKPVYAVFIAYIK